MTKHVTWTVLAAALCAAPLRAQDTTAAKKDTTPAPAAGPAAPAQAPDTTVKPGMTEAQVRAAWGAPAAVRRVNDWTYLFYRNGREREVGYYDTVFLQGGQVVDAITRNDSHVYAGQSSSPEGRTPMYTPPRPPAADSAAGAVTGVQVKPSR